MPLPGVSALAASIPADRIRERAAAILRDAAYQTSLPAGNEPVALDLRLDWLGFLLRALLWAGLAVLVVLGAVWIARRLGPGARDAAAPEPAPGEAVPDIAIESAAALAAEGRYAEAIHALLLETLAALSRAARLAPSLTSREIVEHVPLAPGARDALAGLVDAVEVSWFGGATPGEAEYGRCLDRFHAFLHTYRTAA
jgi:uncharacterized protein DUF4129